MREREGEGTIYTCGINLNASDLIHGEEELKEGNPCKSSNRNSIRVVPSQKIMSRCLQCLPHLVPSDGMTMPNNIKYPMLCQNTIHHYQVINMCEETNVEECP